MFSTIGAVLALFFRRSLPDLISTHWDADCDNFCFKDRAWGLCEQLTHTSTRGGSRTHQFCLSLI